MYLGISLHHAENTFSLGHIQILKQSVGYTETQRLVLFLMRKLSVNTTFMESRRRSLQHVTSRSKNRYVDVLRHKEPEKFLKLFKNLHKQEKEHSQGDKSENYIFIHQKIWEDLVDVDMFFCTKQEPTTLQ